MISIAQARTRHLDRQSNYLRSGQHIFLLQAILQSIFLRAELASLPLQYSMLLVALLPRLFHTVAESRAVGYFDHQKSICLV